MCIFESILAMPAGGDFPYPDMMPGEDVEAVDQVARTRALDLAEEGCRLLQAGGVQATPAAVEGAGAVWRTILAEADDRDVAVVVLGSRGHHRRPLTRARQRVAWGGEPLPPSRADHPCAFQTERSPPRTCDSGPRCPGGLGVHATGGA